jgi:hypothetical protein
VEFVRLLINQFANLKSKVGDAVTNNKVTIPKKGDKPAFKIACKPRGHKFLEDKNLRSEKHRSHAPMAYKFGRKKNK